MFGLGMGLSLSEGGGSGALVIPVTSGLIAQWDASKLVVSSGDGTAVTTWTDLIAGIVATGSGPVYRATGAPNGRAPGIECGAAHGAGSGLTIASGLPTSGTVRTLVCATKPSVAATGGTLIQIGNGTLVGSAALQHMALGGNNYVASDGGGNDTIAAAPVNAATTYTHNYTVGSPATVRINGVAQSVSAVNLNGVALGAQGVIGNRYSGTNQAWEGILCELALFNRALSTGEAQAVEGYLSAKWY